MRNLIETFIDVGSGLILSTLIQLLIFPFFDLHPTVWESFNIAIDGAQILPENFDSIQALVDLINKSNS